MAGVSMLSAEELLSRRVQEMVLNGEEPQAQYMCRVEGTCEDDSPVPIINFSLISSVDQNTAKEELNKLKSALVSWGCFQTVGHGIPRLLLDEIRRLAREFFQLPMEEKQKSSKRVEEFQGYGGDPAPAEGVSLNWSDRLFLEVFPEDTRNYKIWPANPNSFREVLVDYMAKMKAFIECTSKAMAKSLDLQETCFMDQVGERAALGARFNHYSTYHMPDLVLGLRAHQDGSVFTVILQDDVEGLQVLKGKQWFTVPIDVPDALLVLMGDQMAIMTNGIFRSPVHRVITNSAKERLSLCVFYYPEPHKEIGPEEGLINEEKPRLFQKVKNYGAMHFENHQRGKRALHLVQV